LTNLVLICYFNIKLETEINELYCKNKTKLAELFLTTYYIWQKHTEERTEEHEDKDKDKDDHGHKEEENKNEVARPLYQQP
jgi:hypothetical protein